MRIGELKKQTTNLKSDLKTVKAMDGGERGTRNT